MALEIPIWCSTKYLKERTILILIMGSIWPVGTDLSAVAVSCAPSSAPTSSRSSPPRPPARPPSPAAAWRGLWWSPGWMNVHGSVPVGCAPPWWLVHLGSCGSRRQCSHFSPPRTIPPHQLTNLDYPTNCVSEGTNGGETEWLSGIVGTGFLVLINWVRVIIPSRDASCGWILLW